MHSDEYHAAAARTLIDKPDATYTDQELLIVWFSLGLVGEAGEVADTVKKAIFHRHGVDRDHVINELGDVLWYVAALCTQLQVSMSSVMQRNIDKLQIRYPDGYSSDASRHGGTAR